MTAQSTACATANSCVTITVDQNEGGAGFTLAGTWSGTVQFEGSADGGTTYQALNATPSNSSTAVTSATGNGVWQANVAGFTQVRIRCSTFSSGTIVATINGSSASARAGGAGGTPGAGTANAGVFNISTSCGGSANCLQWVDDDTTDNCGTATTNFVTAINAAGTVGAVQVNIGGSGPGKAYLLQTCHLIFPAGSGTININATLDAGTNSAANLIQIGNGVGTGTWRINGGTFRGGASLTVAGIEVTANSGNTIISDILFFNFGAGNATLGSCTNYAIKFDNFSFEGTVQRNTWTMSDSTTGRCFGANGPEAITAGEGTIFWLGNTIGGVSGSICASQGIIDGGFYGTVAHNNIGNIAVPIRLQGGGHTVEANQLDTEGCTASGVNAVINFGANASSTNVDGMTIIGNIAQFGAAHATNFFQRAGNSTATMSNVNLIGNRQAVTASTTALLVGGTSTALNCGTGTLLNAIGQAAFCTVYGNSNLTPPASCGSTSTGWMRVTTVAYCGFVTAGANIGSSLLLTAPAANGQATSVNVTCQILVITAPTTSGTVPQCVLSYTDANTSVAETLIVTPVAAANAVGCTSTPAFNALPPQGYSCQATVGPLALKTGTTLNVSTINYASVGGTAQLDQAAVTVFIN